VMRYQLRYVRNAEPLTRPTAEGRLYPMPTTRSKLT
jgi:hypothetical protein